MTMNEKHNENLGSSANNSERLLMHASGYDADLFLWETKLYLKRKGILSFGFFPDKEIAIKDITAVIYTKKSIFRSASFQLILCNDNLSGQEIYPGYSKDSNTIVLSNNAQCSTFQVIGRLIEEKIAELKTTTPEMIDVSEEAAKSKLVECPDCNKEISRRAITCPHCGCPLENIKRAPATFKRDIPTCPTCQSSNIETISLADKVKAAALVGVLAVGKVSKTFKCHSCGYQW